MSPLEEAFREAAHIALATGKTQERVYAVQAMGILLTLTVEPMAGKLPVRARPVKRRVRRKK